MKDYDGFKRRDLSTKIYDPKEFRDDSYDQSYAAAPSGSRFGWKVVLFLAVCGIAGAYFLERHSSNNLLRGGEGPFEEGVQWHRPEPLGSPNAPLTLHGNTNGKNCSLRLVEWMSQEPVMTVSVPADAVLETDVPVGSYQGTIICTDTQRRLQIFKPTATLDKIRNRLDFLQLPDGAIRGMQIVLSPKHKGNLETRRLIF